MKKNLNLIEDVVTEQSLTAITFQLEERSRSQGAIKNMRRYHGLPNTSLSLGFLF